MGLKVDNYTPIRFSSQYKVAAFEFRSANAHRGLFEIEGNGEAFTTDDYACLRKEIGMNVRKSLLMNTFAFSLVITDMAVSFDSVVEWVDNTNRRGGPCQWVIVKERRSRRARGIHMWVEGKATPLFESLLDGLAEEGYSVVAEVKKPTGFVKLAPYFGMPCYRFDRYSPEQAGAADGE